MMKENIESVQFKIDYTQFFATKLDAMECKSELKEDIHALDRKIDSVKNELKEDIHALDRKIDNAQHQITNQINGLVSNFWKGVFIIIISSIIFLTLVNFLSKKLGF